MFWIAFIILFSGPLLAEGIPLNMSISEQWRNGFHSITFQYAYTMLIKDSGSFTSLHF